MERNREYRELVRTETEKLENERIFESAFFRQMMLSVAGEITGGTLKKVDLVKEPEWECAGTCSRDRVVLNLRNFMTVSFPTMPLMSDSLVGILGHECGHWNFSDFEIRKEYLQGLQNGKWYQSHPKLETEEEKEHLKEINQYLEKKHPVACSLLCETASFIQNMLEDIFVEQKMCERYPGSIRRGILQNRVRKAEWIPSLKVQLEKGYNPISVLLNLMAQYSLSGTVNNWEEQTGEILDLLEMTKPVIDEAVTAKEPEVRMAATNRILLIIWDILAKEIREDDQEKGLADGSQEQEEGQPGDQSSGDSQSGSQSSEGSQNDSQQGNDEIDGDSQSDNQPDGQSPEGSQNDSHEGENQSSGDSQSDNQPDSRSDMDSQSGDQLEGQSSGASQSENQQSGQSDGDAQSGSQPDGRSDVDSQSDNQLDGQSSRTPQSENQKGNQSDGDLQNEGQQDDKSSRDSQNENRSDSQSDAESQNEGQQDSQSSGDLQSENQQGNQSNEESQSDGQLDGDTPSGSRPNGQSDRDSQSSSQQGGGSKSESESDGNSKTEDAKNGQIGKEAEKEHQTEERIEESEGTQPQEPKSIQENNLSDAESRRKLQKRAAQILEQLQKQLPSFLLEKEQEDAAEKSQSMMGKKSEDSRKNTDAAEEQEIDTSGLLMEYIQEMAENNAQRELDEKTRRELLRELSETSFDGDHQKVHKDIIREIEITQENITAYQLYEECVKDVMRRMKSRLLPVLSCQGSRMERNLFFGAKLNYQALYDPGKRIFQNMEIVRKVNTAVALLIDLSGSMFGERIEQARLCALCLYEFCHSVGIPILIYGHNVTKAGFRLEDETVSLYSFAEFDADRNDKYRIASMAVNGCNRDGAALCFVGEKLAKRPEKIKLLFSISDGFPNATLYSGQKAEEDLLHIKESLERRRITVLTAAIGSDKEIIQRIYKEGFLDISDIEQLPFILPKQILMRMKR